MKIYMNHIIKVEDARQVPKNKNRIRIKGWSKRSNGASSKFDLVFIGTQVEGNYDYIPENVLELFIEDLVELIGYAPFPEGSGKKIKDHREFVYKTYNGDNYRKK